LRSDISSLTSVTVSTGGPRGGTRYSERPRGRGYPDADQTACSATARSASMTASSARDVTVVS
jgi:hypothetical protein